MKLPRTVAASEAANTPSAAATASPSARAGDVRRVG
jgi:hypothetical protein